MALTPTQTRTIDPFQEYYSNATNRLTRLITRNTDCLHGPHSIDVTSDSTSNTSVVVSTGQAFKDDVLIEFTASQTVDLTRSVSYEASFTGTPFSEDGYYYICLDYTYVKSKPAPTAKVVVLLPSDRSNLTTNGYLLLKVANVDSTANTISELLDYDPENTNIKRTFSQLYVALDYELPTFNRNRDEGRLLYVTTENEFYFGSQNAWVNFNSAHSNIDTQGTTIGQLVYIDDSLGKAVAAQATSFDTLAQGAVINVGPGTGDLGKILLFGRLQSCPIETGLTVSVGDKMYTSASEAGAATNVIPGSYPQYVGLAIAYDSTAQTADIWFAPSIKGGGGGGGGTGDITREDLTYHFLLNRAPYLNSYYDVFKEGGTVTTGGGTPPTYNFTTTDYDGVSGSTITSPELIDPDVIADGTTTLYKFLVHVEKEDGLAVTAEYNADAGGWTSCNLDETIIHTAGFTSLQVRITWGATGTIYSFGVLYNPSPITFTTDTRLYQVYDATADITIGSQIIIPGGELYTANGKSLEVYLNRVRLVNNVDFTEHDTTGYTAGNKITTNILIKNGDKLVFIEHYGYVDTSVDSYGRILDIIGGATTVGNADKVDGFHGPSTGVGELVGTDSTQTITNKIFDTSNTFPAGIGSLWTQVSNITEFETALANQDNFILLNLGTYTLTQDITPYDNLYIKGISKEGCIIDGNDTYEFQHAGTTRDTTGITISSNKGEAWFTSSESDSTSVIQVGDLVYHSNTEGVYKVIKTSGHKFFVDRFFSDTLSNVQPVCYVPTSNFSLESLTIRNTGGHSQLNGIENIKITDVNIDIDRYIRIYYCSKVRITDLSMLTYISTNTTVEITPFRCSDVYLDGFSSNPDSDGNDYFWIEFDKCHTCSARNITSVSELDFTNCKKVLAENCHLEYNGIRATTCEQVTILNCSTQALASSEDLINVTNSNYVTVINYIVDGTIGDYLTGLSSATNYYIEFNDSKFSPDKAVVGTIDELEAALSVGIKEIFIRNGTYTFTQTFEHYSNMTLIGESKEGVILDASSNDLFTSSIVGTPTAGETCSGNEGDYFFNYSNNSLDSVAVGDMVALYLPNVPDIINQCEWPFIVTDIDTAANKIYTKTPIPKTFSETATGAIEYNTPWKNITFKNMTLLCDSGGEVSTGEYVVDMLFENVDIKSDSEAFSYWGAVDWKFKDCGFGYGAEVYFTFEVTNGLYFENCRGISKNDVNIYGGSVELNWQNNLYTVFRDCEFSAIYMYRAMHTEMENVIVSGRYYLDVTEGYKNRLRNVRNYDQSGTGSLMDLQDSIDLLMENVETNFTGTAFALNNATNVKMINCKAPNASTIYTSTGAVTLDLEINYKREIYDASGNLILVIDEDGNIQQKGFAPNIRTITDATSSVIITDHTLICDSTNDQVVNLLPAASAYSGQIFILKNVGIGNLTAIPDGVETIDGNATASTSSVLRIQTDGTTYWII